MEYNFETAKLLENWKKEAGKQVTNKNYFLLDIGGVEMFHFV